METVYYLVLVPMVYLAVAVFVVGALARIIRVWRLPRFAPTLQIFPEKHPAWLYALGDALFMNQVRRHKPVLWVFLMAFHIGLILLLLGHLELIADIETIQIIPHDIFLGHGIVGLVMAICLLFFMLRRTISPTKELTVLEDYFILILLFLTVLFGAQMDWARQWFGFDSIGVDEYRTYLYSLVTFQPTIEDVAYSGHTFMLALHVFFANLFLMWFPFSNLMHAIFTFPMNIIRRG